MGPEIKLVNADVASLASCNPSQQVRHFENNLYIRGEKESEFVVPRLEYTPMNTEQSEARLLRLHPTTDVSQHVRCDLEFHHLSRLPPFIAIQNARGYRNIEEAIEVAHDSIRHALVISAALERFLRYLRSRIEEPTYIWVRYACVLEYNLQEQQTYWTREFSDKMYAAASMKFDMHEINSRLIENGYLEKVVDSRYRTWKKKWYGHPDEVVLPRVCPVRLGTKPDNESLTMQHRYMPLDMVADEIRIVCVMPAEHETAPIIMHVAHCPIKCEVTYIALSYRWGTDEVPEQVILNGQVKSIRKNLAEAIRLLRMEQAIVPLWIDAISINQQDAAERSRQVRRMGKIYDNAMSVYSWAGPKTDDTDEAIDLMLELEKHPMVRFDDFGNFDVGVEPGRLPRMCAALYKLITRQYFRRTWILQEIALASSPAVMVGAKRAFSFDTLDKAAYHLHDMVTRDPALISQIVESDSSLQELDVRALAYARKIFYFRYLVSGGLGGGNKLGLFYRIKISSPGFLDALMLARDFECTDPRDRIYGLWNLAQDKSGLDLTPGYGRSYEQVYVEFSKAWALQHTSLDVLGAVEATSESLPFYRISPSWCANWNIPATSSSLVRKDYLPARFMSAMQDQSGKIYAADGDVNDAAFLYPLFSFQGSALHCTGLLIDRINGILGDAPEIPAGSALKSTWRFLFWMDRLEQMYRTRGLDIYEDPGRAICAMMHGDSVRAWLPATDSKYDSGQCLKNERYVCLPAESRHVLPYARSYDRAEAMSVVDTVLRGRRPFVTDSGYMGLGPAYITEDTVDNNKTWKTAGWQLAIVAGCSVPLLLRQRGDETYELIGTCFVQGWMDGEWIETMMGADDPAEFWNGVREGAQLVIT